MGTRAEAEETRSPHDCLYLCYQLDYSDEYWERMYMGIWNVSKTVYPNGSTLVKVYDGVLGQDLPKKPCKETKQGISKADLKKLTKEERNALELAGLLASKRRKLTSYTEKIQVFRLLRDFGVELTEEQENLLEMQREKNLQSSIRRTQKKIMELARSAKWDVWATFTVAPQYDRYDFKLNSKRIREWMHEQHKKNPSLLYLVVPEYHKDKAIHFHALIGHIGEMELLDSGKHDSHGRTLYSLPEWKYGFTSACMIDSDIESQIKISRYLSKYISKAIYERAGYSHKYYASNNLGKPKVTKGLLHKKEDALELVEQICAEDGKEIVYQNKHKGYINVDYYELA